MGSNPAEPTKCFINGDAVKGYIFGGLVSFSLVFGGIGYLTSAGSPIKQKESRNWISAGILGLIILLSSYVILNTINPELIILSLPVLEKISFARLHVGRKLIEICQQVVVF